MYIILVSDITLRCIEAKLLNQMKIPLLGVGCDARNVIFRKFESTYSANGKSINKLNVLLENSFYF